MSYSKVVDLSELRKFAQLRCTQKETAAGLNISQLSFRNLLRKSNRFKEVWEQGLQESNISLRRKQFNLATSSAPMAIHLGKQHLGQSDKTVHQHTGADGGPIETVDVSNLNKNERDTLRKLLTAASTPRSGQD